MKRILLLALPLCGMTVLSSCSGEKGKDSGGKTAAERPAETQTVAAMNARGVASANDGEIKKLDAMYSGRVPSHGDIHEHANTGGTSDGKSSLSEWKAALASLDMDFAGIVDHKQVLHMYLPEWDPKIFIGGTEPGVSIPDRGSKLHYNMVFSDPEKLKAVLNKFPRFGYTGGNEGHFRYPSFSVEEFRELISCVKENAGFFVQPHPTSKASCSQSEDPLYYWYADYVGIEVICKSYNHPQSETAYKLWTDLLSLGKRVWACAGGDTHRIATNSALTTIYSKAKTSASYVETLATGDFTAGACGIQMCIGSAYMGSALKVKAGDRLILRAGDIYHGKGEYRLDLFDKNGVFAGYTFKADQPIYVSAPVKPDNFYRAVVTEVSSGLRIGIGNPIWTEPESL